MLFDGFGWFGMVLEGFGRVWEGLEGFWMVGECVEGFCLGNILKYTQRYGNKEGKNRKDLLKVLHYALIALHVHDLEHEDDNRF